MTSFTATAADSGTMFRRNLLHMLRYPGLTVFVIAIPVLLLLLFVYVFGGTLGAGLPGGGSHGAIQEYLAYVVPGILLIGVAGIANGASIGIAQDMTEGIVARFRSMAVSRAAVLNGHVLGNTVQGLLCLAIVLGVGLLMGLRPGAGPLAWLTLVVFLALVCFAVSWVAVAMGMTAKTVESASNWPMIFTLLPFLGSGFVPTSSMPGWLRQFADWQPFTAFIETARDLLAGQAPDARYGWLSLLWCALFVVGGYVWARSLYERKSVGAS
ncbi:ABC transporter permease [Sinomonas susongensis]|uniref:ABC transporter permease n=1 Tax=Sinomonas susongensis TaxID=1324851 RepID=UPI001108A612|nr:ABC transporter permease [Sinomonas susongensis]